jgi:hypothetical protein
VREEGGMKADQEREKRKVERSKDEKSEMYVNELASIKTSI